MKFFIYSVLSVICIINGIENAAVIHPIHVQTIPLGSRPSSTSSNQPIPSADTPWPTRHSRSSFATSRSTTLSNATNDDDDDNDNHHHHHHHDNGLWSNRSNCIEVIIGIVVLAIVLGFLTAAVKNLCMNKKKTNNNGQLKNKRQRLVVVNKSYISTISGKREENPPAYADVHRV